MATKAITEGKHAISSSEKHVYGAKNPFSQHFYWGIITGKWAETSRNNFRPIIIGFYLKSCATNLPNTAV